MRKIVAMIGTTDGRKDKNGEENEVENMQEEEEVKEGMQVVVVLVVKEEHMKNKIKGKR